MKLEKIELEEMAAVIEAILFVANDPVAEEKLLEVFGGRLEQPARAALDAVLKRYARPTGGIVVDRAAGGLRLVSRPDLHGYLRRFFEVTGSNKLSMPALETLAIVAYRQPITALEIAELRGVNSQGVLKNLLERRLVRVAGRKEVVGKPFLYATTRDFLMHFGLRHLDELPPLEQFEEMWGGDSETDAGAPADFSEQAGREEAEVAEKEQAWVDAQEVEEEMRRRLENEAAELPVDAVMPDTVMPDTAVPDIVAPDVVVPDSVMPSAEQVPDLDQASADRAAESPDPAAAQEQVQAEAGDNAAAGGDGSETPGDENMAAGRDERGRQNQSHDEKGQEVGDGG